MGGPWDPDEVRCCQRGTSVAMKPKKGSGQSRQGQEAENGLKKEQPSCSWLAPAVHSRLSSGHQGWGTTVLKDTSNLRDSHALLRAFQAQLGAEGPRSVPRSPHGLFRGSQVS